MVHMSFTSILPLSCLDATEPGPTANAHPEHVKLAWGTPTLPTGGQPATSQLPALSHTPLQNPQKDLNHSVQFSSQSLTGDQGA